MKKIAFAVSLCVLLISAVCNARTLEKGMTGEDVKQWQLFLIRRGFMKPPALGNYSDRTYKATIAFQKKHGLQGLGMVGPKTVAIAKKLGYKPVTQQARTSNSKSGKASASNKNGSINWNALDGKWVVVRADSTYYTGNKFEFFEDGTVIIRGDTGDWRRIDGRTLRVYSESSKSSDVWKVKVLTNSSFIFEISEDKIVEFKRG